MIPGGARLGQGQPHLAWLWWGSSRLLGACAPVFHHKAGECAGGAVGLQWVVQHAQGGGPAGGGDVCDAVAALVAAGQQHVRVVAGDGVYLVLGGAGPGADRGAAELAGHHGGVGALHVGVHAADVVLVDVAPQQHGVARGMPGDRLQQACAGGGVAVPAVGGGQARGVVARRKQGLLGQHAPVGGVFAACVGGQAGVEPLLLCCAQQCAGGAGQVGAVGRAHGACAGSGGCAAGLPAAVLAAVQQVDVRQPPPAQAAVDLQGVPAGVGGGLAEAGCAQGHVFVEGLPCGAAQRKKAGPTVLARLPGAGGVVVLHFVVVPGHGPGAGGVGGLQGGVAFVQGVAVAKIRQRGGVAQAVGAGQVGGVLGGGVFVDVVAEEEDDVGLVGGQVVPGGVVAVFPPLARGEGDAQRTGQVVCCRCGARAAHGAYCIAQHEAVVVPARGLQAVQLYVHAVAQLGQGGGLAFLHDVRKVGVVRHFPVHGVGGQDLRGLGQR